jgi:hypothetical protein
MQAPDLQRATCSCCCCMRVAIRSASQALRTRGQQLGGLWRGLHSVWHEANSHCCCCRCCCFCCESPIGGLRQSVHAASSSQSEQACQVMPEPLLHILCIQRIFCADLLGLPVCPQMSTPHSLSQLRPHAPITLWSCTTAAARQTSWGELSCSPERHQHSGNNA